MAMQALLRVESRMYAAPLSSSSNVRCISARPLSASVVVPRGRQCNGLTDVICTPKGSRGAFVVAAAAATAADPHWKQALAELDTPRDAPERKIVCCQVAPAVRVAIAESFGLAPGSTTPGQLAESLRRLGFDFVFDTLFSADLTIMEEGAELVHRLTEHLGSPNSEEPLPMFTSCCPGWVDMMEKSYPNLIPYVSSCKSPQMMMGAMVKTYFAQKQGVTAKDICLVSIMPCVRKQGEADREWFASEPGVRDVEHVITTAELGKILQERGIMLPELPEGQFDNPLGEGSGAGVLFGTTGGVMEAAIRTAYEIVTKTPMERLKFDEVRGMDGIKEAQVHMVPAPGSKVAQLLAARKEKKAEAEAAAGTAAGPITWDGGKGCTTEAGQEGITLRIAVANGLGSAKKLITKMQAGEAMYDFVEVMACPAGCVGGGGQPRSTDRTITQKRQAAIYSLDERSTIRRSYENPSIQKLYGEFLGEPLSHKAHDLLHTHYVAGAPKPADKAQ